MSTREIRRILGLTALLWGGALVSEVVAIVVAPTAVYLDDASPSAAITLYNPSTRAEEVSVEAVFGYPTTDSLGNVLLHLDAEADDPRSAAGWIQALPRRLVVPPGERRVVRLLARPPASVEGGEYWTRLVLTSRGQSLPVVGAPDSGRVQVGLDLEVRTIIAVTYRKGEVGTGIDVARFEPEIRGDTLIVHPRLTRLGEGAYIGRLDLRLVDPEGQELRSWAEQVAVYREYGRRWAYDVSDLPAGSYRLELRLGTDRDDIAEDDRLETVPVEMSAEVVRP